MLKRGVAPEFPEIAVRLDENFLANVVEFMVVAGEPGGDSEHLPLVPPYQLGERLIVAREGGLNEAFVGGFIGVLHSGAGVPACALF